MPAIEKDLKTVEDYLLPFEGERHLATIVLLPYREDTWREKAVPATEKFLEVVKAIALHERVVVVIDPRIDHHVVRRFQMANVTILRLPYDDSWARDNTPIFLRKGDLLAGVDFGFNAWGGSYDGLYEDYEDDNRLSRRLLLELRIPRFARKDFVLEGGSILSDGEGTILTTEECLLSPGRNPTLSKEQIEENLLETLGAKKVLFLPYGVYEDETDGHVDNIASFLAPGVVLLGMCKDEKDPQYERSQKNKAYLEGVTDAKGRKIQIVEMPLPSPLYLTKEEADGLKANPSAVERLEGRRLAASYCNLYQGRDFVLLPQFGVESDREALTILESYYKGSKTIHPLLTREILLGGGNIHCITKEIPYSTKYVIEPEEEKK